MKLLVVTGTGLRHRIFLSLLKREIGAYWTNTLIQGTEKAFIESSAINDDKARNTFFNCGSHFYRRARRHILCAQLKDIPLEKYLFDGKEDHFESKMIDMLQEGLSPIEPDKVSSPMYAEDPNTDGVYSWLNISKPDLIIIFGGRILKGPWLTTARLGAMNMHYGYLPHYRSSSSIQFALFHERFDLAGPTIHYIDAGIDTGPIIKRSVVKINPPEALSSVLANVYMTGITNLIDCAKKSIDNESRLPSEQMNAESSYYP
ncbi:MAG TPA: hypothetical protein ENI77_00540, partial [Nitrospirae bacterium]|nr:hypothetical protein [Nitrospirota bacterium]